MTSFWYGFRSIPFLFFWGELRKLINSYISPINPKEGNREPLIGIRQRFVLTWYHKGSFYNIRGAFRWYKRGTLFLFLRQNLLKSDLIHYEMKIGKIMKKTLMYWFLPSKINFFTDTMKSSPGQYGPCGIGGLILETYKRFIFSLQLSLFDCRSGKRSIFRFFLYGSVWRYGCVDMLVESIGSQTYRFRFFL